MAVLYVAYLFVYWVWDTTNSQKNRFRQQERGTRVFRKSFPQLPWQTVENPKTIDTAAGNKILVDGWCKYRCMHLLNYAGTNPLQMARPVKSTTPAIFSLP